jgi:hypothetical protein
MSNKTIIVSVDEPWNFEGPDGKNVIKGKIVKIINNKILIFKANKEQTFDEGKGIFFVFFARHKGEILVHKNKQGKIFYEGAFGAGLIKDTNYLDKDVEIIEENSIYVFIGSINY